VRLPDYPDHPPYEVAGVAGDVHGRHLPDGVIPAIYFPDIVPSTMDPIRAPFIPREGGGFIVRTTGDPMAFVTAVRRAVRTLDARVPVAGITTLEALESSSRSTTRIATVLLAIAAAAGLALGTIGLYGVVAYSVASRTPELGLRMALGATPALVRRMILSEAALLAGAGALAGAGVAAVVLRALGSVLFGVGPTDLTAHAVSVIAVLAGAMTAGLIPARRAARIDPGRSIREA
jgi:predicted lysophospholipase L1 biosynthesis ABC-type transport system permease subunit